jgi:hypothetical protein
MSDIVINHPKLPFTIVHRGQEVYLEYPTGATKPVGHEFLVLGEILLKVGELGVEPEKELEEETFDEEVKYLVDKATAAKRVAEVNKKKK